MENHIVSLSVKLETSLVQQLRQEAARRTLANGGRSTVTVAEIIRERIERGETKKM